MKSLWILAVALFPVISSAAFQTGQSSNLRLGDQREANNSFFNPRGVAVDPATGKVFVADTNNHRVLRFGSTAAASSGSAAEAVFGQPDLNSRSAGTTQSTFSFPAGVWVDVGGRLWVADSGNNRVLRFNNASTAGSGAAAAAVLGQVNFTSGTAAATNQNSLKNPYGVVVDGTGRLYVADRDNHRVLRYDNAASKANGGPADGLLGQVAYSGNSPASTQTGLSSPSAVAIQGSGTGPDPYTLYVADTANQRILRYDNPEAAANGANAFRLLGQPNYGPPTAGPTSALMSGPTGVAVSSTGTLFVSDYLSHRVLRYDSARTKTNGAPADGVLGQSLFTTSNFGFSAAAMASPGGIALDASGTLWVADTNNQRVTRFASAATKPNGGAADGLLGHANFTDPATVDARRMDGPRGVAQDPVSGKVFVSDTIRNRILRFASAATLQSGASAEAVLGQPDFTSSTEGATAGKLRQPAGLAMDSAGRLWVADRGNGRVLRFDNAASKASGAAADGVLGQANFTTVSSGPSNTLLGSPGAVAINASGTLWVADQANNRCVGWTNAASKANGAAMDLLFGQTNFTTNSAGTTASTLSSPLGIAVADSGKVYVADTNNHRVVRFVPPSTTGDGFFGQNASNTAISGNGVGGMNNPVSVALDVWGTLWVADASNHRVLWFKNASAATTGVSANGVLGQSGFGLSDFGNAPGRLRTPWAVSTNGKRHVWVADEGNDRALRFSTRSAVVIDHGINPSKRFFFTFESVNSLTYEVETSTDLVEWTLHSSPVASGPAHTFTDPAPLSGKKFYRATTY